MMFSGWHCCICYFCFDNFICQINITLVGQFIILQKELRELYDHRVALLSEDESYIRRKLAQCVEKHQQLIDFTKRVNELYRNVILGVVVLLSLLICLELFQLMTVSHSPIKIQILPIFSAVLLQTVGETLTKIHYCVYACGSITQLYFFTLTCNDLTEASLAISDAAYDVQWFLMKSKTRRNALMKDLQLVIMRSQKINSLYVGGFSPVTLMTFTSDVMYCLVAIICDTINNAKFFTFMLKRKEYHNLLRMARDTLWAGFETEYGRKVLKDCENQAMIFVIVFATFAQCSGILYLLEPILLNIQNNSTDVKERLFPFKIWFDLPIYESPNFEIWFLMEMFVVYHACILYFCFDNYLILVNIFITGQFSILKNRLEVLYNKKNIQSITSCCRDVKIHEDDSLISISQEFKSCIRQHQLLIGFVDQVESVYTLMNLISVLLYSGMICLSGYQLIVPGNTLMRRIKFVAFTLGCLTQLLSFSFTCNNVSVSSVDLSDGPYNSVWYTKNYLSKGRSQTKDFIIVIMRSQRPCYFTGAGFFPVTLDTLKSVLTTAFSYLTLIRQSAQ
ncbi:odorant receptor 22c-like [Fopius arisanus]|uniref:Odorant receptor 22c-like n=1 Tax=Fopius arisanus TaxID=64838 RepID=A0A9R1TZV7_9HYME|nr:PREDICTED: odorant receptor 22c-like [Fopius arisanus]